MINKSYIFSFLFVFAGFACFSQNKKIIDSLSVLISKAPDDTNKVILIYNKGRQYRPDQVKERLENYILALNLAKKISYKNGRKKIYMSLISYLYNNEMYGLSSDYCLEYVDFCEKEKLTVEKYTAYNMLGNFFTRQGKFDEALKYYNLKGKYDLEQEDYRSYGSVLTNISAMHLENGDPDKALQPALWSAQIFKRNNMPHEMAKAALTSAKIYLKKEDFITAEEKANEALAIYHANNEKTGICNALYTLGKIYAGMNKPDTANKNFTEALVYADSLNLPEMKKNCYKGLLDMYSKLKNYKESYEYQVLYERYEDTALRNLQKGKLLELEVKYDIARNESALKDAEIEGMKREKKVLLAGIAVLIFFLVFTFRAYLRKKNQAG